jgi:hypothetical protein
MLFYVTALLDVLNLDEELHMVSVIQLIISEPLLYSIQAFLT